MKIVLSILFFLISSYEMSAFSQYYISYDDSTVFYNTAYCQEYCVLNKTLFYLTNTGLARYDFQKDDFRIIDFSEKNLQYSRTSIQTDSTFIYFNFHSTVYKLNPLTFVIIDSLNLASIDSSKNCYIADFKYDFYEKIFWIHTIGNLFKWDSKTNEITSLTKGLNQILINLPNKIYRLKFDEKNLLIFTSSDINNTVIYNKQTKAFLKIPYILSKEQEMNSYENVVQIDDSYYFIQSYNCSIKYNSTENKIYYDEDYSLNEPKDYFDKSVYGESHKVKKSHFSQHLFNPYSFENSTDYYVFKNKNVLNVKENQIILFNQKLDTIAKINTRKYYSIFGLNKDTVLLLTNNGLEFLSTTNKRVIKTVDSKKILKSLYYSSIYFDGNYYAFFLHPERYFDSYSNIYCNKLYRINAKTYKIDEYMVPFDAQQMGIYNEKYFALYCGGGIYNDNFKVIAFIDNGKLRKANIYWEFFKSKDCSYNKFNIDEHGLTLYRK